MLSIVITTFNRRDLLKKLLDSIDYTEGGDLEVVISDDGSTDDTSNFLEQYLYDRKNDFSSKVLFDQNKGRATALKRGLMTASKRYTLIMDSDDVFIPGCLNYIIDTLKNRDLTDVVGICYLCEDFEGNILGDEFPNDGIVESYLKIRADFKVMGDKKEVVLTSIIKRNMYELFNNERRIPTSYLWSKIDKEGKFLFKNKAIACKDYLPGGMSANINKIRMNSPSGSQTIYTNVFNSDSYDSISFRFKSAVNYYRYMLHGSNYDGKLQGRYALRLLAIIPAVYYYYKDKKI